MHSPPDQMVERARTLLPALRARRRAYDEKACFPADNFADLRAAGLTAMTVPLEPFLRGAVHACTGR